MKNKNFFLSYFFAGIGLVFTLFVVKAVEANHYTEAGLVGQCTWYAAEMRPDLRFNRGGASTWVTVSRNKGYQVDNMPEVGAIAVWQPGVANANKTWGHVAYVKSVSDSTHFTVSECNWPVGTCYRMRDITWESGIEFVHTSGYQSGSSQTVTQQPVRDPEVTYTYLFSPTNARIGDEVKINVGASDIAGFREVKSIVVKIDGRSIGNIQGSSGQINWDTSGSSAGTHTIQFQAVLSGWTGSVSVTDKNYLLQMKEESTNQKPNKPSASSPSDWAVTNENKIQLCSQANGDPNSGDSIQGYFFEIYDSAQNWQSEWVNSSCVTTTTLGVYNYQWHVKVRDQRGLESDWSDARHFTVQSSATIAPTPTILSTQPMVPSVPSLRDPSNNGTRTTSNDIWFSWKSVSGATAYYLEYWGGPLSTLNSGWINDTAYHVGTMWPGTYSWHVRAKNDAGESSWSDTWSFTIPENIISTNAPTPVTLVKPNLSNPGNGSSMAQLTDVTLSWNSSANATQYKVEVWGGPYRLMTSCNWQGGTSCHIGQMHPGTMSWRVKSMNASGVESDWSDTWSFTIQNVIPTSPPPTEVTWKPSLSNPGNGSSYPQITSIDLSWNSLSGANQYKVELWGGPYSLMVPCDWQGGTSCHIGQMWPGTMFWHVKSRDSSGKESEWSEEWTFVIQN